MYAVMAAMKLQRERLKSIEVKPEVIDDFDAVMEVSSLLVFIKYRTVRMTHVALLRNILKRFVGVRRHYNSCVFPDLNIHRLCLPNPFLPGTNSARQMVGSSHCGQVRFPLTICTHFGS